MARPLVLSLAALRSQPRRAVEFTMECAGNHGLPYFSGGIGNARWAGVQLRLANVEWITRIELTDRRFVRRFMARDYVTVREQGTGGDTVWTFSTAGQDRLKSAPARVVRGGNRYATHGAAGRSGEPGRGVDRRARLPPGPAGAPLLGAASEYGWRLWAYDWGTPEHGEHTVRSRAFDRAGNVQPPPGDPFLSSRRTYWEDNGQITRRVLVD